MSRISSSVNDVLNVSCSPEITRAANDLVAVKSMLDSLGESYIGGLIVGQIFPEWHGYRSLDPFGFAQEVLPFYWYERTQQTATDQPLRYKALVPTAAVVGDSWRWTPESIDENEQSRVIETALAAFEASDSGHTTVECARYFHIPSLGIVLAHEGKNRVALFKKRGLPHIPAVVSDEDYPIPERLRLFDLNGTHLAVLDKRLVERVAKLDMIRDLMGAYCQQRL
ncbi:hypothetical protein [Massilia sp. CCM 8734]|uniref:hypothetical protein n=1 Tax=Massilia sp. CCM 8734 TaxID=2609283 RepID=UPI00141FC421|nr:hypothetical protein [Massilia sp. CCM 8734]NHZ99081.1 hypothetical protein [Massilia sp. CCM 8734]